MKTLNVFALLGTLALGSNLALADCMVTGATGDGGEVVVCTGVDTDGLVTTANGDEITVEADANVSVPTGDVIDPLVGDDTVRVLGGTLTSDETSGDHACVLFDGGNNTFFMSSGLLRCQHGIQTTNDAQIDVTIEGGTIEALPDGFGEVIQGSSGDDVVEISGGTFIGDDTVIQIDSGNDRIVITGGTFVQPNDKDQTIDGGAGDDFIAISNAVVDGTLAMDRSAILGGSGTDEVVLGDGADIRGLIEGGSLDDNVLVFAMGVPAQDIRSLCAQIRAQGDQGIITINGFLYEWQEFPIVRCQLGVADSVPIPTMGQPALLILILAMGLMGAGLLGRRDW